LVVKREFLGLTSEEIGDLAENDSEEIAGLSVFEGFGVPAIWKIHDATELFNTAFTPDDSLFHSPLSIAANEDISQILLSVQELEPINSAPLISLIRSKVIWDTAVVFAKLTDMIVS